jgi:hypothetical protein
MDMRPTLVGWKLSLLWACSRRLGLAEKCALILGDLLDIYNLAWYIVD